MIKRNKGYSMIVLIIAIIVILILAGVSISSLQTSRERTEIMNFIFDLTSIEERIQNYYTETGTLPTVSNERIDVYQLAETIKNDAGQGQAETFLSQLSQYDNENYYLVDLTQLKGLSLRETYRGIQSQKDLNNLDNGYIVNEGSLKVYVEKGTKYKAQGDKEGTTYYTLTSRLVNGQEVYAPLEEDIIIIGNPQVWVKEANIRVVLPKRSLTETEWDGWKFKWDFGPKTEAELKNIPSTDTRRNFKYGEKLIIKSNGVYTFYVEDPEGNVTLRNINVEKIDDVPPEYVFSDGGNKLIAYDNGIGIKFIKFKKLSEYKANVAQAQSEAESGGDAYSAARTKVDYYLMDGNGSDLIYEFETIITEYLNQKSAINAAIANENDNYDRWVEEHPVDGVIILQEEADAKARAHNAYIQDYNRQLAELNKEYAYLNDLNGSTDDSRLVLYIEDYAGNGNVVGDEDFISTKIASDSYNIDISRLTNE